MAILVLNAGSSSLRFALFDEELDQVYKGHIDAIGQKHCHFRRSFKDGPEETVPTKIKNHEEALSYGLGRLQDDGIVKNLKEIKKVAHRVVHGGEAFKKPTRINFLVLKKLAGLNALAPLHNPSNLSTLKACLKKIPSAKHFAVFDTAFHHSLPAKAFLYGLPYALYKKEGIRRYGFHGTSHAGAAEAASKHLKKKSPSLITCHIGNGVSLCAIKNGKSIDTSMGFTPLEGPMMGTRSGSIDPAIIFHLQKKQKPEAVHHLLEHESGFKGLSGIGSDIRSLWAKPKAPGTLRTFEVFSYQVAKLIGSYFIPLGGLPDAIVFTAGIGENAFYLRRQICDYLKPFGLELDEAANKKNAVCISKTKSSIKVLVLPSQEEKFMAQLIKSSGGK
ncbi:MAG: acetate/propionate family kinase [Candidatus Gracilibacteria bacterium]